MDRRQFLAAAGAGAFALVLDPLALAGRIGGTWLTFVTADLESHVVVAELGSLEPIRRIRTAPGPRSIETAHGSPPSSRTRSTASSRSSTPTRGTSRHGAVDPGRARPLRGAALHRRTSAAPARLRDRLGGRGGRRRPHRARASALAHAGPRPGASHLDRPRRADALDRPRERVGPRRRARHERRRGGRSSCARSRRRSSPTTSSSRPTAERSGSPPARRGGSRSTARAGDRRGSSPPARRRSTSPSPARRSSSRAATTAPCAATGSTANSCARPGFRSAPTTSPSARASSSRRRSAAAPSASSTERPRAHDAQGRARSPRRLHRPRPLKGGPP